jgi:hypothetical protein
VGDAIRAEAMLSFQGETRRLSALVDLDRYADDRPPDFHALLARAAGMDPDSYLYEALETQEIAFSDPSGLAAECCRDGRFDWERFARERRGRGELALLNAIARRTLGVADLEGRPELKAALLAAYRAGEESRSRPDGE